MLLIFAFASFLWYCTQLLRSPRLPVALASLALTSAVTEIEALHHMKRDPLVYVNRRDDTRELKITNDCPNDLYPGISTQGGSTPSQSGFKLSSGNSQTLWVSADWQGRVWGRTNCSFNSGGTGSSNNGGNNGGGSACTTGDCNGVVNCKVTVRCCLRLVCGHVW